MKNARDAFKRKKQPSGKSPAKPASAARNGFNNGYIKEPDKIVDAATGRTRVIDALLNNDVESLEKLLKAGASPNKATKDGKTPLHYAARLGMTDAIALLGDYGAQVNPRDKTLKTPLFDALDAPQAGRVLSALFKLGAKAEIPDVDGRIPLHAAAETGSAAVVKRLMAATENPNRPDKKGAQPLHLAAAKNSVAVVQTIMFDRVALFSADHQGDTALHHAARRTDSDVADYLLKTEAARLVNAVNLDGRTPLHLATHEKNIKLVRAMIDNGGDVNLPDREGFTALHEAIHVNDKKLVRLLIENGANVGKSTANGKVTPLTLAISKQSAPDIITLLLEHDASINTADAEGVTPLMAAARRGNDKLMWLLLESGANPAPIDKRGQNVLHHCATGLPVKLLEALITGGADVNLKSLWTRTPLMAALQDQNPVLAELLVDKGADPNVPDGQGYTPLHIALQSRRLALVDKLLEKGADPNVPVSYTRTTALHIACQQGMEKEAVKLIAKGADVNAKDHTGRTPLHYALQANYVSHEVIRKLLEKGADPLADDQYGSNAYDMAHSMRRPTITEMFRLHVLKTTAKPYTPKPPRRPPWDMY